MDLPAGCPKKAKDKWEVLGEHFYTDMEVGVVSYRGTCSTRFKVNVGDGGGCWRFEEEGKSRRERIEESAGAADLKARIYLITE